MSLPLAFTISDAVSACRVGRTVLYEEIKTGRLRAVKRGRRTLILHDDLIAWLANLPNRTNITA